MCVCVCVSGWVGGVCVCVNEFIFDVQRAFVRAWGPAVVPEYGSAHTAFIHCLALVNPQLHGSYLAWVHADSGHDRGETGVPGSTQSLR